MKRITRREVAGLRKIARQEFPHDPALQEVHIARKILTLEAKLNGLSFLEYAHAVRKSLKPPRARRVG